MIEKEYRRWIWITLSVSAPGFNIWANCCRNFAFVASYTGLAVAELAVASVAGLVGFVEDALADGVVVGMSIALCETGSTIANGFLRRLSTKDFRQLYWTSFLVTYFDPGNSKRMLHVIVQAKEKERSLNERKGLSYWWCLRCYDWLLCLLTILIRSCRLICHRDWCLVPGLHRIRWKVSMKFSQNLRKINLREFCAG